MPNEMPLFEDGSKPQSAGPPEVLKSAALRELISLLDIVYQFEDAQHEIEPMLPHFREPWYPALMAPPANADMIAWREYESMRGAYHEARNEIMIGPAGENVSGLGILALVVKAAVAIVIACAGAYAAYMIRETIKPESAKLADSQADLIDAQREYEASYQDFVKKNPGLADRLERLRLDAARMFKIATSPLFAPIKKSLSPWLLAGAAVGVWWYYRNA